MASKQVTGSIKGMYQGVSQQSPFRRTDGQCESMLNCRCSLAEGTTSRPGSTHQTTFNTASATPYVEQFEQGLNEKLHNIIIHGTNITIVDNDDVPHVVDTAAVAAYLSSTNDAKAYVIHTFKDKLYLLNKEKVCAMQADVAPASTADLMLYVQRTSYARNYNIKINNGTLLTYDSPEFVDPPVNTHTTAPQDVIATSMEGDRLCVWFQAQLTAAGITTVREGNVLYSTVPVTVPIEVSDNSGLDDVILFSGSIESKLALPPKGIDGFKILYVGKDNEDRTDYWMGFTANESGTGMQPGKWKETVKPGALYKVDAATMPQVLYLDGATWKIKPEVWADKIVGGGDNNPLPTFVGNTANWIGTMQNRLVLLSKRNFVTTQNVVDDAASVNWFITTQTQPLATDPIDIPAAGSKSQELLWGCMSSEHLIITARSGQFIINGSEAINNANVKLVQSSSVANSVDVRPVEAANSVFFLAPKGKRGYTQITEYTIDNSRLTPSTTVITKHVPSYLAGDPVKMACDPVNNLLYVLMQNPNAIYVYEWYKEDSGKQIQAAWHKWEFSKTVLSITVLNGQLHLVTQDVDKTALNIEIMDLTGSTKEQDFWSEPALDSMHELTPVVDNSKWVVNTPFRLDPLDMPTVVVSDGFVGDVPVLRMPGVNVQAVYISEYQLELPQMKFVLVSEEDGALVRVQVGYTYDSEIEPTMPYPKDFRGETYIPSRLLYKAFDVYYERSGVMYFDIKLTATRSITEVRSNFKLGINSIGRPVVTTGKHHVRIGATLGEAGFVIARRSTHIPFSVSHIVWTGRETKRGSSV